MKRKATGKYHLESLVVGMLDTNCYILADTATRKAAIIDPGGEPERIIAKIRSGKYEPVAIINTHGHMDHIEANAALKDAFALTVYLHRAEAEYMSKPALNASALIGLSVTVPPADVLVEENSVINVGSLELTILHTPGHTPGGICVGVEDILFTGDTLFCGTVGRTDLPGGSEEEMHRSLKKLRSISPETRILPGHGPECELGREFEHNPYLSGQGSEE